MKKIFDFSMLLAFLGFVVWYFYFYEPQKPFNTKPFEHKIDSLQIEIGVITSKNDSLTNYIYNLEAQNFELLDNNSRLKNKLYKLQKDLEAAKEGIHYTPSQIDSFFLDRYYKEDNILVQDTIFVPVHIAKLIIGDLKQGDINKEIVKVQDTSITNLEQLITNKDSIISIYKVKDNNYYKIDSLKNEQILNYQRQIDGLKEDIKKYNKRLKFSKIQKILLGAAAVGLVITAK